MSAHTTERQAISGNLISRWEQISAKLSKLADEFPEEKYETSPAPGVRSFGDVLRHIAFWNQYVADSARGQKADDTTNELPKKEYATKATILSVLGKSSDDAAAALREHKAGLDPEKAALAQSFIEHNCEHYGQLVVYARMAGIVPPASRN